MTTLKHVTTANYTKDIDNPVPVFGSIYNEAVDQINLNTVAIDTAQAAIDAIEAQNSTLGGTTMATPTYKILVSLTSANLLGMNAAPLSIIPAPGAGRTTIIKSCTAIFDSTATPYANGGVIYLSYNSTTPITNNVAATFLTEGDKVYQLLPLNSAGGINTLVNTAVTITNDTAPFITGTGVLRLIVEYEVITTGL